MGRSIEKCARPSALFIAYGRYIVCGRERTCLVYGRKQTFPSCLREKRTISDCYIAYRQGKLEEIFINN